MSVSIKNGVDTNSGLLKNYCAANTSLKTVSKCSFTRDELRFFDSFRLALTALMTISSSLIASC